MGIEGTRLGPYEVIAALGAGGMGEVYRARDSRLKRDVAIKVLPADIAVDVQRVARFRREAEVLAALNHPNIATVHGFEEGAGHIAIVMELVDGESLQQRLQGLRATGSRLDPTEALKIARQVCDALDVAHDRGIVHRDLKPGNVMVRPDGHVKVVDFGLAKASSSEGGAERPTAAPTAAGATRAGTILGTTAYMSPEQARGHPVDKRADIWAFGCVLYEMLAGKAAFARETATDTIVAVIEHDPDWTLVPATVPPGVVRLLQRCLEKDPRRRLRDIADAGIELDDALSTGPSTVPRSAVHAPSDGRPAVQIGWRLAAVAAIVTALGAAAIYFTRPARGDRPATRLSLTAPGVLTPQTSVAVSPDGQRVAFVATDQTGRSVLWIRALDSLEPRALPGTQDAAHPFWSPDGRALGFLAGGKLKRIDVEGSGGVLTLADTTTRAGASWSRLGTILFVPRLGELASIPATGGPVQKVQTLAGGTWPFFLPDGRHYLFVDRRPEHGLGIYAGLLDSTEAKFLVASNFKAAYADSGYLLTVQDETLMAQPFDVERLELGGEPSIVAEGIWTARGASQAGFSVSATGVLAYVNSTLFNVQLTWIDRTGRSLGSLGSADRYSIHPQLSADGSRVAIARGPIGAQNVWVVKVEDATASRLTFTSGSAASPVWAADGHRVLYQLSGQDGTSVYDRDANGAGSEELVGRLRSSDGSPGNAYVWDSSRDGRFVVYSIIGRQRAADLWVLPLDGDRTPYQFAESPFHKTQAQISPNGRWIAYTSYDSGKDEVYVQSFPMPGSRRQVSTGGGMQPRWRRDGRELFYLGSDQYIHALPVQTDGRFDVGNPTTLFRTRILPQGSQSIWFETAYDVSPDGQRFLFAAPPDDPGPPMTVVLNWPAVIKR